MISERSVPADDILLKKQSLDKSEYDEIKRHPIKGAMICVRRIDVPGPRAHCAGIITSASTARGIPDGIKGDKIEFFARIISVADAFDAMMSDRHYRRHLSLPDTRKQLQEGAGTQFDADVVKKFLHALDTDKELKAKIRDFDEKRE